MAQGVISEQNVTTTPLGLATSWQGAYEAVLHWGSAQVFIFSDVPSVTDGVQFLWSDDGITDRITDHAYTYLLTDDLGNPSNPGRSYNLDFRAPYLKIKFTKSGADNQTVFRVVTTLRETPWAPPVRRLSRRPGDEDQGLVTHTHLAQFWRSQARTTTPLAGGASFNTGLITIKQGNQLRISITADVDSAANGVRVDWYNDTALIDDTLFFTYSAASPFRPLVLPALGREFRITYTNGATPQGTFRMNWTIGSWGGDALLYALGHPNESAWVSGDGTVVQLLKRLVSEVLLPGTGAAYTDRSLAVTTGGTAQQLMAANASRKALYVHNTGHNAEIIWASDGGTAAVQGLRSVAIAPYGYWSPKPAPLGAISILAPTTGTKVTAGEA